MMKRSKFFPISRLTWKIVSFALIFLVSQADAQKKIPAPSEIQVPDFKTYSFENTEELKEFKTEGSSNIVIENSIFKKGHSGMKWTWNSLGDSLVFKNDSAFKHLTGENPNPIVYKWITETKLSSFSLWVYNEHPVKDALWFEIGDGKTVDTRFWMSLDFSGWRLMNAMYGRDMIHFPNQKTANTLRIIPPKSVSKGSLIFDDFSPRRELDVRFVKTSKEVPWAHRQDFRVDKISPTEYFAKFEAFNKMVIPEKVKINVPQSLSDAQVSKIKQLQKKYLSRLSPPPVKKKVSNKTMQAIRIAAKKHNFTRSSNGKNISGTIGKIRSFWSEAGRIAIAFLQSDDPQQRTELRQLYMNYVDWVIQQGHSAGYGLRTAFARPMWLMKAEMKKQGNWKALLQRMRQITKVTGELDLENPELNADYANTILRAATFIIFFEDNPRQIYKDLKTLQHWLETVARNGEMKPDGAFFHHIQYYTGYNVPATPPLVEAVCLLDGSEFAAPTMHLYLRRVVYAYHLLSASMDMPRTLAGRWAANSQTLNWGLADIYKKLAFLNNPDSSPYFSRPLSFHAAPLKNDLVPAKFDRDMAEIYLSFADYFKKENATTKAFRKMGLKAHDDNGNLSINYAVAMVQRRDDWMVFIRGQRYPFISGENYAGTTNDPGRYMNYGYMEVISQGDPVRMKESSWENKHSAWAGWDYNHFPGTTCRALPPESLRSHFIIDERMTSETFAVGTSLAGNGVFALKLKEDYPGEDFPQRIGPVRYWLGEKAYMKLIKDAQFDLSFKAKKSYFAFENRIVCLGSDITSKDKKNPLVTTLFQHTLTDAEKQSFKKFPDFKSISSDENAVTLLDKNGTGYYVSCGNDPIKLDRGFHKNPYYKKWKPTDPQVHNEMFSNEGNTELAFINHGVAADHKGYEYCVLVRTSQEQLDTFAKKMSKPETAYYKVLQKDRKAHIVLDIPSQTTGYALFEAGSVNRGPLISIDHPCVLMIKKLSEKELILSLADPRISGDHSNLDFTEITLKLKGNWKTESPHISKLKNINDITSITIRLKNLMRTECKIHR